MELKENIITGSAKAIHEAEQNYTSVLIELYVGLAEKAFSYLVSSGGEGVGFPFSFTGDDGRFHLGIVFAPNLESATDQLSSFKNVVKSRAFDESDTSHSVNGFMTKEMIISKIKQSAVELPLLNYIENN
jgi:hypothetical protein